MGCQNCTGQINDQTEIKYSLTVCKKLSFDELDMAILNTQSYNESEIDLERTCFKNISQLYG